MGCSLFPSREYEAHSKKPGIQGSIYFGFWRSVYNILREIPRHDAVLFEGRKSSFFRGIISSCVKMCAVLRRRTSPCSCSRICELAMWIGSSRPTVHHCVNSVGGCAAACGCLGLPLKPRARAQRGLSPVASPSARTARWAWPGLAQALPTSKASIQ